MPHEGDGNSLGRVELPIVHDSTAKCMTLHVLPTSNPDCALSLSGKLFRWRTIAPQSNIGGRGSFLCGGHCEHAFQHATDMPVESSYRPSLPGRSSVGGCPCRGRAVCRR